MKLPKRNLAVQELIEKTDEESHIVNGPLDKSADSDAVHDETVVATPETQAPAAEAAPVKSERDQLIEAAYLKAQQAKAEAPEVPTEQATAAETPPAGAGETSQAPEATSEASPEAKPEDELNESNPIYAACLKAAGDFGYSGDAQKLRAKELYQTEVKNKQKAQKAAEVAEKMQQQQMAGGGSPSISGLIAKMFSKTGNSGKVAKEGLSERVLNYRASQLNTNFHKMSDSIKDLDKEVGVLNETFGKSLGGEALAEMATAQNIPVSQLVSDIQEGKNTSVQAKLALDNAMSNPEFNSQWENVTNARLRMAEAVEKTGASFAKLEKSHGDRFDAEEFSQKFNAQLDSLQKGNKPISGTNEDKDLAKEFQKHLDQVMEKMRKVIAQAIEKVVRIFSK